MEIYEKLRTRPMAPVLTAVGLALLLVTLLSLSLSVHAEPTADLEVSKKVNTDQAAPGDTLTYTIHITNTTYDSMALWMTDTLPPEVDYVTNSLQLFGSGSADVTNDVLTWTVADFAHSDVIIIYNAEISSAITSATITNTAEVTGTGTLVTSNMVSTGVSLGELQVSKEAGSSFARPGEQLDYTIHISHVGGGAISAVSMTDHLPPEVSYASGPSVSGWADGSCGVSGNEITCTGRMEPAEAATIDFTVVVSAGLSEGTYFTNTVYVNGAGLPLSASVAMQVSENKLYYLPIVLRNYPPTPILDPIPAPQNGTYTVTWECGDDFVDHYVLQEATNTGFTDNLTEYTATEKFRFIDKGDNLNVFYYRVRADGGWGQGPWSNVENFGFYDSFDDPSSGWPDRKGAIKDTSDNVRGYWQQRYKSNGEYMIYVPDTGCLDGCHWFYHPDAFAPYVLPSDKYCVETKARFEQHGWAANAGLIFGVDESNDELYTLCLSSRNKELWWLVFHNQNYNFPLKGCSGVVYKEGNLGTSWDGWNKLQVAVDGNNVKAYVGGQAIGSWKMSGLTSMTHVGVVAGPYEAVPVDIRYDYFKVVPGSDCGY